MKKEIENTTEEGQSAEDHTFKIFIRKSDVLARILKDNIDELAGRSVDEIKECLQLGADGKTVIGRETEYLTADGKKAVLDSVFDVRIPGTDSSIPVIIGVEGQRNPRPGYPLGKRAEYYLARMVSAQKGRDFTDDRYGDMRKTYSIWCVLEPRKRDLNTVVRYRMRAERTYGTGSSEPEELDTFNIIMMYLGSYNDGLPDSLAIGTAMFSVMGKGRRRKLVKDRFKIELNDDELERLNEMTTLGKDKYDHGYADGMDKGTEQGIRIGTEQGIKIGTEQGIRIGTTDAAVEGILFFMKETGASADEALFRYPIPEEYRSEVESEVRRRLS